MQPKISVIIQFLNSEKYLAQAIQSVLWQTFSEWELILVDGGSHDQSLKICQSYQEKYPQKVRILQHQGEKTLGIFSSRLWGAKEAKSHILGHLDSDDEWHPQFLEKHYTIYQKFFHSSPGMVYCPVVYWWDDPDLFAKSHVQSVASPGLHKPPSLVIEFLERWYEKSGANSGMMISRDILLKTESLLGTALEGMLDDQFLWSFIALNYPVFISPEPLARYRQWTDSTCAKGFQDGSADTLRKYHLEWLFNYIAQTYKGSERDTLLHDVKRIIAVEFPVSSPENSEKIVAQMDTVEQPVSASVLKQSVKTALQKIVAEKTFLKMQSFYRYQIWHSSRMLRHIGHFLLAFQSRMRLTIGIKPLSYFRGDDRSDLSIYRWYIERFLQEFAADIKGHCLEFQEDQYTSRFGNGQVDTLDILHIDGSNHRATLIADLTKPNDLPGKMVDCIICTHVLHLIFDVRKAVAELHRLLKPGGILLVAVPHVSVCDPKWHEYWRFTPEGLYAMLAEVFEPQHITMRSYGNSLSASGIIRGLTIADFSRDDLNDHQSYFAPEVCARAMKEK